MTPIELRDVLLEAPPSAERSVFARFLAAITSIDPDDERAMLRMASAFRAALEELPSPSDTDNSLGGAI